MGLFGSTPTQADVNKALAKAKRYENDAKNLQNQIYGLQMRRPQTAEITKEVKKLRRKKSIAMRRAGHCRTLAAALQARIPKNKDK